MGEKQTMRIIVTKYALTKGMWWIDAEVDDESGYAKEKTEPELAAWGLFLSRKDYALTEEEAREKFEQMRKRRIASLEKSLKKVREAKPVIMDH